jgi:hypothetical protein
MIPVVRSEDARKAFQTLADSGAEIAADRMDSNGDIRGFGVAQFPLVNEDGAVLNGDGAVPGSA